MSEAFKYLADLSPWVTIPIVLSTIFVTLWPKVHQVFLDLNADNRAFENEKRRLELLRLRYEIEALKKSNDLADLSEDLHPLIDPPPPSPQPELTKVVRLPERKLPLWQRFLFGAGGALIPGAYGVLPLAIRGVDFIGLTSVDWRLLIFITVFSYGGFGGFSALLVPRHRASPLFCVMVGISAVLLIRMIVTGALTEMIAS